MAKVNSLHHAFNIGVVDKDKLVRVDQERMRLAAEQQTNLLATTSGRMFLRPGQDYITNTRGNAVARLKDFIASSTAAALVEFTENALRVIVDGVPVARPGVASTVVSGDFSTAAGWDLIPTAGASAEVTSGLLYLMAFAKGSRSIARQQVATGDPGTEHALRVRVERGPVTFICGSAPGLDDYVAETELRAGEHSLAFTPAGSYWIQFSSTATIYRIVADVQVESAGDMVLLTPYSTQDLGLIRMSQSADVAFIAVEGHPQYRLERRSDRSWSFARYLSDSGPMTTGRTAAVRLRPTVTQGFGQLRSTERFFKPSQAGALFRLYHSGQKVVQQLAGEGQYTDPIEVTGILQDRAWTYTVGGTWSGTLRCYRSFDGPEDGFRPYSHIESSDGSEPPEVPGNGTYSNRDEDDNAIIWYRFGFDDGDYVSGSAEITIDYNGGGGYGMCRAINFLSDTEVDIEILTPFKALVWTDDWTEGEWSDARGYPAACAFHEGRLWWGGFDRIWGSVADDYENFDEEIEGESAPISRSIATGGVCQTQWVLPLARLIFGTDASEASARSSSFDEPLTAVNLTLKNSSTIGSAPVDPVKVDGRGLFVDRAGASIFEMILSADAGDFSSTELSRLNTDLFRSGIRELAVQRRPDTRIWIVTNDGSLVCLLYEPSQEAFAFIPFSTDGAYESVTVLPSLGQDRVYFSVKRRIDNVDVRFIERAALDEEARPLTFAKVMDAAVQVTAGAPQTAFSGFDHLDGANVKVWADGAPLVTTDTDGREVPLLLPVSGGEITLPSAKTRLVAGLPYKGRFKTARLAYGAERGTAMLQKKRVDEIGILMTDFVRKGVRYGNRFDDMDHPLDPLPLLSDGIAAPEIVLADVNDEVPFVFEGDWSTDSRVCMEVEWPASFLGLVLTVSTNG